jgi:hypothetical protein
MQRLYIRRKNDKKIISTHYSHYYLLPTTMKIFFFIFAALFSGTICAQFKFSIRLSNEKIVATCFDAELDETDTSYVWKPSFYEQWKLHEGGTQIMRTKIDTFIDHNETKHNNEKVRYRTIITYTHGTYTSSCQACSPFTSLIVLKINSKTKSWELVNFNKYASVWGTWDNRPKVETIDISDEIKLLKFDMHDSGQGTYTSHLTIFALGNEVLSEEIFFTNGGNTNDPKELCSFGTKITIDKTKQQITLHKEGTQCVSGSGETKIVPIDERKTYQYKSGYEKGTLTEIK